MNNRKLNIDGIPSIIWGDASDSVYIAVHGKCSNKENARELAEIADAKGWQTLSFDLPEHGERIGNTEYKCDVYNGIHDLNAIADYAFEHWKHVRLFAGSIGAYFALNAYPERKLEKCLFQSPIANMEYLVGCMMKWFSVTEELLEQKKVIDNPVDPLRWDYYCYIKQHPVTNWPFPTAILYGARDNLQSREVMEAFAKRFGCALTVAENSEHPFMNDGDAAIVSAWLNENV